ncbi:IclR family transcriptional regulator [Enteractinococcus helveticum]|uniref:IclR family transcriptional regulator n=1 Tax=Enteractinococcus helveticum TaxID=1837282 RepID=A0A1B7M0C3_9MICC|nr:IclR family transcriptional regulator [Enteractinococcus helveticum]OAV61516.1 IclR family transcriptional regulator [Enteractinococcus helveticum]
MQKPQTFRKPPQYPVESVDHALALLEMVRDFGRVRISVAAKLLGISTSTAHRLMAMLVYRGYAEQDASRRYVPGPSMGLTPAGLSWTAELRHRARPHLETLTEQVQETSNLVVLAGDAVRFLLSVEYSSVPPPAAPVVGDSISEPGVIGDRRGVVLPADKASGGKAILAQLTREQIQRIFQKDLRQRDGTLDTSRLDQLLNKAAIIRARGFATNIEDTEAGVSALGVAIHDGEGAAIAGLSVSVPHHRFSKVVDAGLVGRIQQTKLELEEALLDFSAHG